MAASVLWFRRDLRLADNPALWAAAGIGRDVVALFVLDDRLCRAAGANRLAFLFRALRSLDASLDGRLVLRRGDPARVVPEVAAEVGASRVLCAADFGVYGRGRDERVARALVADDRDLDRVGSPYSVAPGTVTKPDGRAYQVFTPFYREWLKHLDPEVAVGFDAALPRVDAGSDAAPVVRWQPLPGLAVPSDPEVTAELPEASEAAAHARLDQFLTRGLDDYRRHRDHPALDATSRLSAYLKLGLLHPDQILARLRGGGEGVERLRTELAWREFYADVLWHEPESAWRSWRAAMRDFRSDDGPQADARFEAWAAGRTGYPLVDAGMRQLLAEGWMHNRVRMITASFLVKDLHLPWQRGARHFLTHLVDGDLASNNHGWQWVAGSGTDAAPFFRIFNPDAQAHRWDPDREYVRRFVPEVDTPEYPEPLVDHPREREEALARYAEVSARTSPRAR